MPFVFGTTKKVARKSFQSIALFKLRGNLAMRAFDILIPLYSANCNTYLFPRITQLLMLHTLFHTSSRIDINNAILPHDVVKTLAQ